jgi:hypothetical protein
MHIEHTQEMMVNLTDAQREVIRELSAAGWAICALSPSFVGGSVYTQKAAEDAMANAGYLAVYEANV